MMGDGTLSQDEINALLSGGMDADDTGSLPVEQIRALFARAGESRLRALNAAASGGAECDLHLIHVGVGGREDFAPRLVRFDHDFAEGGRHFYLLSEGDDLALKDALIGGGAALMDAFSALLNVDYVGEPQANAVTKEQMEESTEPRVTLTYTLVVGDLSVPLYETLDERACDALLGSSRESESEQEAASENPINNVDQSADSFGSASFSNGSRANMSDPEESIKSSASQSLTPNVQGVKLPNLSQGNVRSESRNISLLMDVSMELTVELGRTRWQIKDILGMGEGTIIELDKLAGEPVDILVNHNLIARGEVVVIDENFGVRVTEIVSGMDKVAERR